MNVHYRLAAMLTVLVVVAHSYLGEKYILIRLFHRGDLPRLLGSVEFTKDTLRLAWHITSVGFIGLAVALCLLPPGPASRGAAQAISVAFGASGVVALAVSKGRHLSWIAFFVIAALAWLG